MNKKNTKMTFDDLFKKRHYRNILILLFIYGRNNGLRQIHFRYALMDNPGLGKDSLIKMKEFFDSTSRIKISVQLHGEGPAVPFNLSIKGSIGSRQKLTNYLTKLVEMGILKKYGTHPNIRYELTKFYHNEMRKSEAIDTIKKYSNDNVSTGLSGTFATSKYEIVYGIQPFGIQEKLFSQDENKMIMDCLMNIQQNAQKILEIKYNNLKNRLKINNKKFPEVLPNAVLRQNSKIVRSVPSMHSPFSFCFIYSGDINENIGESYF